MSDATRNNTGMMSVASNMAHAGCTEVVSVPFASAVDGITMVKQRTSRDFISGLPPLGVQNQKHSSGSGRSKSAKHGNKDKFRRVTDALTARELYESASEPDLVPEPLTLRRQTRIVSAPAAPQSTFSTIQPLRMGSNQFGKHRSTHFRDRPQSQQLALLDIATRHIASGIDVVEVATIMELDLNELVDYISCFTVGIRDAKTAADEELSTAGSRVLTTSDLEQGNNNNLSTPEDAENKFDDGWEDHFADEETLIAPQLNMIVESVLEEIESVASDEIPHKVSSPIPEEQVTFYDASNDQIDPSPPNDTFAENENGQMPVSPPYVADRGEPQHRVAVAVPISCTQGNASAPNTPPSTRLAPSHSMFRIITNVPWPIWIVLAIVFGRFLGILVSELQAPSFQYDYRLGKALYLLKVWAEAFVRVLIAKMMARD